MNERWERAAAHRAPIGRTGGSARVSHAGRNAVNAGARLRAFGARAGLNVGVAVALLAVAGCEAAVRDAVDVTDTGGASDAVDGIVPAPRVREAPATSVAACRHDGECAPGLGCWEGRCVWECATDTDCAVDQSCDGRGRCGPARPEGAWEGDRDAGGDVSSRDMADAYVPPSSDVPDELAWSAMPPGAFGFGVTRITWVPGRETIRLPLQVDGPIPDDGVLWRMTRSDEPGEPEALTRVRRWRATDPEWVEIEAPRVPRSFDVVLQSRGGSSRVHVSPVGSVEGRWAGAVMLDGSSRGGVPITFEVRTRPAGASLADAERAWLALPSEDNAIFAPERPERGVQRDVVRPLDWDATTGRWVARFESPWPIPAGGLPSALDPGAVRRSLRVEIDSPEPDRMTGRIHDRWDGLLPLGGRSDAPPPPVVHQAGTVQLERVGPPSADAFVEAPLRAAPTLRAPRVPLDACTVGVWPIEFGTARAPSEKDDTDDGTETEDADPIVDDDEAPHVVASLGAWVSADEETRIAAIHALLARSRRVPQVRAQLSDAIEAGDGIALELLTELCHANPVACLPGDDARCARALVARMIHEGADEPGETSLVDTFITLSHDAVAGLQLAAFAADQRLRTAWLRDAVMPSFVQSLLRAESSERMQVWKDRVLGVHRDILASQLDGPGLAVLAHLQGGGSDAVESMLVDLHMSLRATLESATTLARWGARAGVVGRDADRLAAELHGVLGDTWRAIALFRYLNDGAGLQSLTADATGAFGALVETLDELGAGAAERLLWREGEVVLHTSLDPLSSEADTLRSLEATAERAIDAATFAVDRVLEGAEVQAQSRQSMESRMEADLRGARQNVIAACGLPPDCTASDAIAGRCDLDRAVTQCGLPEEQDANAALEPLSGDASEAARTLHRMVDAVQAVHLAQEELDAHVLRTELVYQDLRAHADEIAWLAMARAAGLDDLARLHAERQWLREEGVDVFADNLAAQMRVREEGQRERAWLEQQVDAICEASAVLSAEANAQVLASRAALMQEHADEIESWHRIRVDGAESDYESMMAGVRGVHSAQAARRGEAQRGEAQEGAEQFLRAGAGLIGSLLAGKPMGIVRSLGSLVSGIFGRSRATRQADRNRAVERAHEQSELLGVARQREQALRQADLELATNRFQSRREQAGLEESVIQLAAQFHREQLQCRSGVLQRAIQASREQQEIDLAALHGAWQMDERTRANALTDLEEAYRLRDAERSADAMLRNEVQAHRQRQIAWHGHVTQVATLEMRVIRAEMAVESLLAEYAGVRLRGDTALDQVAWLEAQRGLARSVVASPAMVFVRAARIRAAEEELDRARERLWDWLVALEYYAVRPFPEQRVALLLASSPARLRAVAEELRRLRSRCGGAVNRSSVAYSLRRDLAGLDDALEDAVTGETMDAGRQFRAWLARVWLPPARRERLASGLVAGFESNVAAPWAAAFRIDLASFAHLGSACNARVESVGVELVGDLGFGRPNLMLLHEGAGEVRSCQPGIDAMLAASGRVDSPFGSIASLRSPARAVSLLAGVNRPPEPNERNRTLAGLPLAGEYTVVVPRGSANNEPLAWENLDDIVIHVEFTTQDAFLEGACR